MKNVSVSVCTCYGVHAPQTPSKKGFRASFNFAFLWENIKNAVFMTFQPRSPAPLLGKRKRKNWRTAWTDNAVLGSSKHGCKPVVTDYPNKWKENKKIEGEKKPPIWDEHVHRCRSEILRKLFCLRCGSIPNQSPDHPWECSSMQIAGC